MELVSLTLRLVIFELDHIKSLGGTSGSLHGRESICVGRRGCIVLWKQMQAMHILTAEVE